MKLSLLTLLLFSFASQAMQQESAQLKLTTHGMIRIDQRNMPANLIKNVMSTGKKEVQEDAYKFTWKGIVVVTTLEKAVITTYAKDQKTFQKIQDKIKKDGFEKGDSAKLEKELTKSQTTKRNKDRDNKKRM